MKQLLFVFHLLGGSIVISAQAPFNISVTNPQAEQVLKGSYNPLNYLPVTSIINHPARIACELTNEISTDSLHNYLIKLSSFHNRNTYSDTISNTIGIGAARKWVYTLFENFSGQNENRLLTSYLQFEMDSSAECGSGRFKNIFAVLPGSDTSDKSIVIIEAHVDSRCEDGCDTDCIAHGADDNGSGTALVLELARVMSKFSFPRTVVFLVTVGEEQGLIGAEAFAQFASDNGIAIRAVQNNDIVGGIFCGETSSSPSCPIVNDVDSTQVRIFSLGNNNSPHKGYARFIKMMYEEWLLPLSAVPMTVSIMLPEDRTGRGGDHIPFRQEGFTAVRFTSANEHGHGNPLDSTYHDRQHSTHDILGIDTNGDLLLDSFFVDFNYLARNTAINGMAAAIAAVGPKAPVIQVNPAGNSMLLSINDDEQHLHYRVGVRSSATDFSALYTLKDSQTYSLPGLVSGNVYRVSAASVDANGAMSVFSNEVTFTSGVNSTALAGDTLAYHDFDCNVSVNEKSLTEQNGARLIISPNPFSGSARFDIKGIENLLYQKASILLLDLTGRQIESLDLVLKNEANTVLFERNTLSPGIYSCLLITDGAVLTSAKLVVVK